MDYPLFGYTPSFPDTLFVPDYLKLVKQIVQERKDPAILLHRAKDFLVEDAKKSGIYVDAEDFPDAAEYFKAKLKQSNAEVSGIADKIEDLSNVYENPGMTPQGIEMNKRVFELHKYMDELQKYSLAFKKSQIQKQIKPEDFKTGSEYLQAKGKEHENNS